MSELGMKIQDHLDLVPRGTEYGITIVKEDGDTVFEHNPDQAFYAASLGKLAIAAVAGERMETDPDWLDTTLAIREDEKQVGGTGILKHFPDGYGVQMRDLLHWMLAESDNVAAKMVVRNLGGPEAVNDGLDEIGLDLNTSGLTPLGGEKFHFGNTTSHETTRLFGNAMQYPLFAEALQTSHCDYMLRRNIDIRQPQRNIDEIADVIKEAAWDMGIYNDILQSRRTPAQYPSKEGTIEDKEEKEGLRHDVAKIGRFTVAVLSRSPLVPRWKKAINRELVYEDHSALKLHAAIGRLLVQNSEL